MSDKPIAPTKAFTVDEARQIQRSILACGDAAKKLLNSGLNKRAVCVLIQDATGVPMKTIRQVLEAAAELPKLYCQ